MAQKNDPSPSPFRPCLALAALRWQADLAAPLDADDRRRARLGALPPSPDFHESLALARVVAVEKQMPAAAPMSESVTFHPGGTIVVGERRPSLGAAGH